MTLIRRAAFSLLAVWSAAVQAAPPEHVKLTYDTSYNGMVLGEIVETLVHDNETYAISSEGRGRGILAIAPVLKRTSRGRITPQGLRPDEFRDQRGARFVLTARFDWAARSITQDKNGKDPETLPMPATAQDPLSLAYTFAFFPPTGKAFEVMRADGRWLTPFRFTVVGSEKLKTPAGELQTLHISKERDGPGDKATDIWFASEHSYLPVRVLVVDKDGTRVDQILTRIGN
jgi:Protein of unknown function (DUF3108)